MEEYKSTYHASQLVITGGEGGDATWSCTQCHYSPELAKEEVAKKAYQSLTGFVDSRNTVSSKILRFDVCVMQ